MVPLQSSEVIGNCSAQSRHGNQSKNDLDPEEMSGRELSFHLCITDDRGLRCSPIVKDSPIKPGRLLKVMLDWTEKTMNCMMPATSRIFLRCTKRGSQSRKLSRKLYPYFACLDAFLKEEPLGA